VHKRPGSCLLAPTELTSLRARAAGKQASRQALYRRLPGHTYRARRAWAVRMSRPGPPSDRCGTNCAHFTPSWSAAGSAPLRPICRPARWGGALVPIIQPAARRRGCAARRECAARRQRTTVNRQHTNYPLVPKMSLKTPTSAEAVGPCCYAAATGCWSPRQSTATDGCHARGRPIVCSSKEVFIFGARTTAYFGSKVSCQSADRLGA